LIGYLVHIFHFKNVHYININHTFKVETMNEISLSKIVVYSFSIDEFYGKGKGYKYALEWLLKKDYIKDGWLRTYNTKKGKEKEDFKGIYVFYTNEKPFYIGISKSVVDRVNQHLKGGSHNSSSMAFSIGKVLFEIKHEIPFEETRKAFQFEKYVRPVQDFLKKQRVSFLHVENDEELYLFEVYCAMKFGCELNKFETH